MPTTPWAVAVLTATTLGTLAGCSLFNGREVHAPAPRMQAPPPPPPKPQFEAPIDTHTFTLTNPDDEVVGAVQITHASKEDTLPDIARRFNIGYEEIVRANPGVDPWIPGDGRSIVVPTRFVLPDAPREGIVINVAAMRLYFYPPHKKGEPQVVYTYPIGIGKVGWSTPMGVTKIVLHEKDPIWRPSAALRKDHFNDNGEDLPAVVGPGPDNPLGKYEMRLGWPSYLIHGTNKPYGIGLRSSHGCMRLYPEDIEKLYFMVPDGMSVRVVNQPFLFGWKDRQLYLQAYTVLEDDSRDWNHAQQKLLAHGLAQHTQKQLKDSGIQIDWDSVKAITHEPRGIPVSVTGTDNNIDAVLAAAPTVENRIPEGADWDGGDASQDNGNSAKPLLQEREPAANAKGPVTVPTAKRSSGG
ncbi:MAG TPA: L,D-transpeptidase family protein [Steroidobacteraceae bacterium]|jgi:L,D-transpeptidase ErfK/SrfK|nr:L,D-transpeptidase family protein [Steroidobacteraceae bacterium]